MSTSLSRQLEQLRQSSKTASSSGARDGGQSVASLGPSILSTQLTSEELTVLCKESLYELSIECPVLGSYHSIIFKDDPNDILPEDEDVEMATEKSIEDVLFLLSSFLRKPSAQYVLQYLITRHKVHVNHAETLLFAAIPHYDKTIFHRIVEAIPTRFAKATAEEEFPRWSENFKTACHPATKVGIARHLASDQGFFKLFCHVWVRKLLKGHIQRFYQEEGVSYDGLLHFFTSMMVQGLNLCSAISEHQSYNLLQVILAGLKSDVHNEYRSAVVILFASLVPRVSFNAKVTKKILRSLNQMENLDIESLSMLALLFRCQIEQIKVEDVLIGYLRHKQIMLEQVFINVAKQVNEDQEFARRLLKSLALLSDKILLTCDPSEDLSNFLDLIQTALEECLPSRETAEIFIVCISKAFLKFKAMKKENADDSHLKKCFSHCKKITELLRKSFIEEFARKSAIKHEKDIIFIEGVDNPTSDMVLAKKILLDNEAIRDLFKSILDQVSDLKSQSSSLKSLLTPNTEFLVSQLDGKQLACLCLNVLKHLPTKFKIAKLAMTHLISLTDNKEAVAFLHKESVCHGALMLRLMFQPATKNREHLNEIVEEFALKNPNGLIGSLLPTWKVAQKEESKVTNIMERLFAKLTSVMNGKEVVQLANMIIKSGAHRSAELLTLVILVFCQVVKTEKPKQESLFMDLVKVILSATQHFPIRKAKENHDSRPHMQIWFAYTSGSVPSSAMQSAIECLLKYGKQQRLNLAMVAAIWQKKSVDPALTEAVINGLKEMDNHHGFSAALLTMPINEIFASFGLPADEASGTLKHMHLHAVKNIQETFESNAETVKSCMDFDSPIIPCLLGGLFSDSKKVRKKILECLEAAVQNPVSRTNFAPLVRAFIASKSAILATPENIEGAMRAFKDETRSSTSTFEALLDSSISCSNELLICLMPILVFLEPQGLAKLALHGTQLLATYENDSVEQKTLEAILARTGKVLVRNIEDNSIWEFFSLGIKQQSKTLNHNGMQKSVACAIQDTMSEHLRSKKVNLNAERAKEILTMLIDLSGSEEITPDHLASSGQLFKSAMTKMDEASLLSTLKSIWDESVFPTSKTPLKKRRPVSATIRQNPEPRRWQKTTFFLEVTQQSVLLNASFLMPLSTLLSKGLAQQDEADLTYTMDLLISTLLFIIDKLSAEEKEKTPLDSELIVRCIRNCLNPETKASALMLLAKSTVSSNAEYILLNSIQLFTFVGTHFLQMESRTSFEIACTAIDVLVPHILSACQAKGGQVREMSINILNTFVDASSDMPRHRFCVFMHRLALRLGPSNYLWLQTLLLIKADLRKKHYDTMGSQKSLKLTMEERLQQLRDFFATFETDELFNVQISCLKQMIRYTASNDQQSRKLLGITSANKMSPQDQFDMVRIRMLSFVQSLVSSQSFVRALLSRLGPKNTELNNELQSLVEVLVNAIDSFRSAMTEDMEEDETEKQAKIRKHLSLCYEKVFESALGILPTNVFILLSKQLLDKNQPANIQRKALEVLNARLALPEDNSVMLDDPTMPKLLKALSDMAMVIEEDALNQQLALMCIKSLAKMCFVQESTLLMPDLKSVTGQFVDKSFLSSLKPEPVIAAALLCITELLQSLGPQGVAHLQPFVKWLLTLMTKKRMKRSPVILHSLVVSLQKSLDSFAGFLNPHFQRLIVASCQLAAWHQDMDESDNDYKLSGQRIKQLHMALSRGIPFHNMLAIAKPCYDELKEEGGASPIIALTLILQESLGLVKKSDILASSTPAMDFFMHAFKYRQQNPQDAHQVEEALGDAFLTFGLKVSLEDFKPLFYKLFSLALDVENTAFVATVFHVTTLVANKLKSLFSFVCEMIVQKATTVLQETAKTKDEDKADTIGYVMDALASIFAFNRVDSLLMKSYEDHVNAILEFLDGSYLDDGFLNKIKLCLGQLAATTEDETQWKYLNYQVLMLIRNKSPKIRMTVLDIVDIFVEKRGENYLATLPDSVNFLVEALEDDDQQVENRCRKLIKTMEEVFGQSVESYFE